MQSEWAWRGVGRRQKLVASNGTAREKRKIPIELGTKYFIIMQQFSTLYSSTPCPPSIQTVPLYRPLCIQKNILISCIFCAHFTILHGFFSAAFVVAVGPREQPGLSRLLCEILITNLSGQHKLTPPLPSLLFHHLPLGMKTFQSFSTSI